MRYSPKSRRLRERYPGNDREIDADGRPPVMNITRNHGGGHSQSGCYFSGDGIIDVDQDAEFFGEYLVALIYACDFQMLTT